MPTLTLALLTPLALSTLSGATHEPQRDWPGWLGAGHGPVAEGAPPVNWSETSNVRWKVPIEGKGLSSPVVVGGVVYLTTAVPTGAEPASKPEAEPEARPERPGRPDVPPGRPGAGGRGGFMSSTPPTEQEFRVLALDAATGAVRWSRLASTHTPHEATHGDGSFATPTIAVDAGRVYASFGSGGIFAYDLKGELLWQTDLGDMSVQGSFGEGSSPVVASGRLIVHWGHNGDSFLIALEGATGEEAWRQPRAPGTVWATPVVVRVGERELVVLAGPTTQAYDAKTGALAWFVGDDGQPKVEPAEPDGRGGAGGPAGRGGRGGPGGGGGMTMGAIATAAVADGRIFTSTGSRRGALVALSIAPPVSDAADTDAGALDRTLWSHEGDTPNIPSPLVLDGTLYVMKGNAGVLGAFDVATGAPHYVGQRLAGVADSYASPVAAGGHLYFTGRDGTFEVVRAGKEFASVAVNRLDDKFDATPAIVGDTLILRGAKQLYCIGAPVE